jgi:hypothetical protein
MFGKSVIDGAAAATAAIPSSDVLLVSPETAWSAIAGVLLFAMVVLWLLRDDRSAQPDEPTSSYREAA